MFRDWSIHKLLQFWAISTVIMVLVITTIAMVTNERYAKEQLVLQNQVMPLSEVSRQLTVTTAEFIARQHSMLHVKHHAVDKQQHETLEQQFEAQWNQLVTLFNPTSMPEVRLFPLETSYHAFLQSDERLFALLPEHHRLMQQLAAYPPTSQQGIQLQQQLRASERALDQVFEDSMRAHDTLQLQLNQFAQDINGLAMRAIERPKTLSETARWLILLSSIFVASGMIAFVRVISSRVNQPLKQLRNAMGQLSAQNFATRLPASGDRNEFSLLAKDFNVFASNTEKLIATLEQTRQTVHQRERHISAIINGVPEAILTLTAEGEILDCNPATEKVFKASHQDLMGENLLRFIQVSDLPSLIGIAQQQHHNREFEARNFLNEPISVWLSLKQIVDHADDTWVCVVSDITVWKETKNQLQQTSNELNAIFENAMVGIAMIKQRQLVRVNHKFIELFAGERQQLEGHSTLPLHLSEEAFNRFGANADDVLINHESFEAHIEMQRLNGERFWCSVAGQSVNPEDPSEGTIWLFEDVTQQRLNEERLTRLASVDSLTGLPNRTVFNDRLEHAIHKAQRAKGRIAIFFIDLDHFKHINDSLGHKAGDSLLCEVARRIRSCVRDSDTVARLGGDEFTVMLEDVQSAKYVGRIAEKILSTTTLPFLIDNVEVNISPSIGISLYPADGRDLDMLIRNADAAMYHAKHAGRNNFQFYSAEMNAEASHRLAMETSLRRAVEQNEFYLQFQPQIDLRSGDVVGAEVLLRWNTEQWGNVSPARFVPLLEDTGLISVVGEWVLSQTCQVFMQHQALLPEGFVMAVNLSSRQFRGNRLSRFVQEVLQQTGMPANSLELEITESLLMENTDLAIDTLRELSSLGVTLAIDDFGTGYSSLSYLKQFPLNVLKVDRAFVRDVNDDRDDAAIVSAIIAMAESLGLQVVAEGVETAQQLAFLQQKNCQRAQGFFFSKALDIEALMQFILDKKQADGGDHQGF